MPLPEVHADGEIWSAVLWAVREQIGKDDFEQTLIDALKLTPVRPSMIEARDAYIQAAGLLGVGGPDACQIWVAFAARGLGASAALNPTEATQPNDTALSVLESYDKPVTCGGAPPSILENLLTETAETDNGWQASGLWHRSTRKAADGAYSWWFGQEPTGDYNTGARVVGDLISPPIDLTGSAAAVLSWDQYFRGEGFNSRIDLGGVWAPYLNADSGRVWVSTDGGGSWLLISHVAHDTPDQDFASFAVNLTRFAGSVIRVRFDFDTFTASDNANEGWFVDNIRVDRTSTDPVTLAAAPSALAFVSTANATGPPSQNFELEITGTGDLSWSATVQPAVPWLSISISNGVGPTVLSASVSTDGLPPGVFNGTIEISASGSAAVNVPVTLSVAVTPGAVASWSFEESDSGPGVTITDGSVGGLHGTTVGRGSAAVIGVVGQARLLNGYSDGVIAPASATYTPQQFTVQAWLRLDAYPSSLGVIVSTFGGASSEGWYLAVNSAGEPVLMAATAPASAPWLVGPTSLQPGRWHRIVATYDQLTDQAALYLDGQLQASMQFPGLTTSLTTPLTIGKASWTESYLLQGTVDEIAILPYIQSAFSVAADFASATPPAPVVNVSVGGLWNFDSSLVDTSGNGHTAIAQDSDFGPGVIGTGLRFDGFNDGVSIVNDELLSPASFTVSAWVRLLALPPGWGALISNYDGAFAGWYLGVLGDGKPFLGLASLPASLPSVVGDESIGVGEWSRLTATYDGSSRTLSLYVNGVLAASRKILGLTPRVSGNLVLGKASWVDSHYAAFDLDELVILPRAQTPQEVTADFQSYAGSSDPALARWSLDETGTGPGTVFEDAASGHDATTAGNRNSPMTGISGVARRFEGYPDHAVAEPHSDFSFESFSFSTWVRLDEPLDKWGVMFSTYDGISSGWYLGVSSDRRPILSVSGSPGSSPWLLSSQALELGQWHHVAVTFEGRERRGVIYVDGIRSASAVFSAWQPSVGVSPHFGRASWANAAYLRTILDEPILRGYELTATEVAAEHSTGVTRQNPQPRARWEFEETDSGGGVRLADVVGDRDATTLGTGGSVRSGISGVHARDFSGPPNAARVQPDALFAADAFSFSAWLYVDSSPSQWGIIFSNYDGDYRGWYVALHTDGRLILSVSGQPSFNPWLLSIGTVAAGQWVHVAVTFDGVNRRGAIHLNGVLSGTAVFPAWTPQQTVGPVFARASWDNHYYLDLSIDDARFYDVELSTTEISDLSSLP